MKHGNALPDSLISEAIATTDKVALVIQAPIPAYAEGKRGKSGEGAEGAPAIRLLWL